MKTEHIREFLDLAETLNYSLSASRLYISQPTLTRHIQLMEKELGFPLVNTSSHGITLTRSGELAVPSFRKMLKEYDRFLSRNENLTHQVSGTLRLGILYYAMDDFFAGFLDTLDSKYPNVDFSVSNYQPQALYDDLWAGKIDVASLIFYDIRKHQDLKYQKIGEQKTLVMMRKDHPLSNVSEVTLEELSYSELIKLKSDQHSNEITDELLEKKKVYFSKILYTDNIETVPMMIRKTGRIHLTGEACRKQNAAGICYKNISGTGTKSHFCLTALKDNDNPLIDLLFQEARAYYGHRA